MPRSEDPARERLLEITSQTTPPFAFWSQILPLHPDRTPRTLELMQVALGLANHAVQRFKHALAVVRPHRVNMQVMPAILTPAHGSLPSGHATEAFTIAWTLSKLIGQPEVTNAQLALAHRIAENREYAGVHYEIDSVAGQVLGTVMADYLVARCTAEAGSPIEIKAKSFDPNNLDDQRNAGEVSFVDSISNRIGRAKELGVVAVNRSEPLAWLWKRARAEWHAEQQP
jgi:hypothetical protein